MTKKVYDIVVVGGGVNGCGIALDAAGRGLSVALFEAQDLASATSSASSKLLHGGLRYLENYEFLMVKEALNERKTVMNIAPHITTSLRFCLPHRPHLRHHFIIRIGLFLYDHLARRTRLEKSKCITFDATSPLKSTIKKGFLYSDGFVDDSRLVILNARMARQKGADIFTRSSVIACKRVQKRWDITVQHHQKNTCATIQAKALVNATGPWAQTFFSTLEETSPHGIRMIKGSHIIFPQLYHGNTAYILQNEDKRIIFIIPYQSKFSLVGTTDVDFHGDPRNATISPEETDYLIEAINQHFKKQVTHHDIIASYTGVRPLGEQESTSAQKVSRDYVLTLSDYDGQTPLLSVFGGKVTTYRRLSEVALNKLIPYFSHATGDWTAHVPLPGGHITDLGQYNTHLAKKYPWMPDAMRTRMIHTYGSECDTIIQNTASFEAMGTHYGAYFTERELDFLIKEEWAQTLEDVITRRTKLYLELKEEEKEHINRAILQKISLQKNTIPCEN